MSMNEFFGDLFDDWKNWFGSGSMSSTGDIPHFNMSDISVEAGVDSAGEWENVVWYDSNGNRMSSFSRKSKPQHFSVSRAIKQLKKIMKEMVEVENYEYAASIRDIIKRMEQNKETLNQLYKMKHEANESGDYILEDDIVKQIEVIINGTNESSDADDSRDKG